MVGIWGCVVMWLESGCSWGGGFYIHNPMRMIEGERVRCRYTNQFISRCDDLIESVLGEGLCMYIGRVPTAWHASLAITDSTCAITRTLEEQHCMSFEACHRGGQERISGGCQTIPHAKENLSMWMSWSHMEYAPLEAGINVPPVVQSLYLPHCHGSYFHSVQILLHVRLLPSNYGNAIIASIILEEEMTLAKLKTRISEEMLYLVCKKCHHFNSKT